ncbi:MAG TPA: c-type cytochrome, partial [Gammaproteobacteria bacterium]|nr:c-type cytochrome [Gammaproteobacteria bacterium]
LLLSGCGRPPKQSAKDRLRVQGSQLATFNGCDRCHEETGYILGPSWRQIAKRYKGNPNARRILIGSIKNGSADKWTAMTGGQRMPALGARVSDKDTRIIVNYILSFAE